MSIESNRKIDMQDFNLITDMLTDKIDMTADELIFPSSVARATERLTALVKARRNLRIMYREVTKQ